MDVGQPADQLRQGGEGIGWRHTFEQLALFGGRTFLVRQQVVAAKSVQGAPWMLSLKFFPVRDQLDQLAHEKGLNNVSVVNATVLLYLLTRARTWTMAIVNSSRRHEHSKRHRRST